MIKAEWGSFAPPDSLMDCNFLFLLLVWTAMRCSVILPFAIHLLMAFSANAVRPFLPVELDDALGFPSHVNGAWLTADGGKILYTSDHVGAGYQSIYLKTFPEGEAVKINVPAAPQGVFWSAWYSSEFDRVLCSWTSSGSSLPIRQLYSAPADGGPAVVLNPFYPVSAVRRYSVSEENGRVVYASDQESRELFHLYSVPIDGGEILKLTDRPVLVPSDYQQPFEISDGGGYALYRSLSETRQVNLHRVALAGGPPAMVNLPLAEGQVVEDFEASGDGSSIAFVIKDFESSESLLYVVPADGSSNPVLLHSVSDDADIVGLTQSPDGSWVLFRSDNDEEPGFHLYSCEVENGTVARLSPALDGWIVDSSILPNGRVLMHMGSHDLALAFSNQIGGGDLMELTSDLEQDVTLSRKLTRVSPDGHIVVMVVVDEITRMSSLYSFDFRSNSLKRIDRAIPGSSVGYLRMSPDGGRVVYQEFLGPGESRLVSVPVEGGSAYVLHLPNPQEADVTNLQLGGENGMAIFGEYFGSSRYRYFMSPYQPVNQFPVFAEFFGLQKGFGGDDDMDRIPNGVEYCLNSNPLVADELGDWAFATRWRADGTYFSLRISNQMPGDVRFSAEVLESNGEWRKVASHVDGSWSLDEGFQLRNQDQPLGSILYRGAELTPGRFIFRLNAEAVSELPEVTDSSNQ